MGNIVNYMSTIYWLLNETMVNMDPRHLILNCSLLPCFLPCFWDDKAQMKQTGRNKDGTTALRAATPSLSNPRRSGIDPLFAFLPAPIYHREKCHEINAISRFFPFNFKIIKLGSFLLLQLENKGNGVFVGQAQGEKQLGLVCEVSSYHKRVNWR